MSSKIPVGIPRPIRGDSSLLVVWPRSNFVHHRRQAPPPIDRRGKHRPRSADASCRLLQAQWVTPSRNGVTAWSRPLAGAGPAGASAKTSNESRTIQNRFITPPTNNRAISAQQQPTQYAPWRSPSRRQLGTSRRKPPRPSSALRLTHTCSGTPAGFFSFCQPGHRTRAPQTHLSHRNIQHTARYTELSPTRFKNLWRE
jgi:hypothetical protein